jgi:hypothetical protein
MNSHRCATTRLLTAQTRRSAGPAGARPRPGMSVRMSLLGSSDLTDGRRRLPACGGGAGTGVRGRLPWLVVDAPVASLSRSAATYGTGCCGDSGAFTCRSYAFDPLHCFRVLWARDQVSQQLGGSWLTSSLATTAADMVTPRKRPAWSAHAKSVNCSAASAANVFTNSPAGRTSPNPSPNSPKAESGTTTTSTPGSTSATDATPTPE